MKNKKEELSFSSFIASPQGQPFSKLLVGKLNDKDGDGYPDAFDCAPNDPNRDGIRDWLKKRREKDKPSNDSALGKLYVKPSEESAAKDSGVSYEVKTGSPTSPGGGGSGGGGGSSRTPTPISTTTGLITPIGGTSQSNQLEQQRKAEQERLRQQQLFLTRQRVEEGRRKRLLDEQRKARAFESTFDKTTGKDKFGRTRGFYEEVETKRRVSKDYSNAQRAYDAVMNQAIINLQNDVNKGKITVKEANNQLKKVSDETVKLVNKDLEAKFKIPKPTKTEVLGYLDVPVGEAVPVSSQDIYTPQFGTRTDYIQPPGLSFFGDVKTAPYLEERVTGKTITIDGVKRPVFDTVYVDPSVTGKQFERPATDEELKFIEEQRSALRLDTGTASLEPRRFFSKVRDIPKKIEIFTGTDLTSEQKGFKATEEFLAGGAERIIPGKAGTITGGIIRGIVPTTPGEVGVMGATFGIGAAIGGGVKGVTALAKSVPKIGGVLSTGVKVGAGVGGTYLMGRYGLDVARRIATEEELAGKGEILGETARELLVLGAGIRTGGKAFDIARGRFATRGRAEIPAERLIPQDVLTGGKSFPTAPKGEHFKLFKGTAEKFPELAEGKPGAFHTTPEIFWKGGKIVPQPGTSELAGLYGSSSISPYFSGVSGVSSGGFRLFPKLKSFITTEGKPGVAFLQPKEFRISKFTGKARKPIIEKGVRIKEFVEFEQPPKPGVADIPLMKTEIEAVFRPEIGEFKFKQGKYYTTFKGVRVPIDVFEYVSKTGETIKKVKIKGKKDFLPGEYSSLKTEPYSLIEPVSGFGVPYSSPVYSPTSSLVAPFSSTYAPVSSSFTSSGLPSSPASSSKFYVKDTSSKIFSSSPITKTPSSYISSPKSESYSPISPKSYAPVSEVSPIKEEKKKVGTEPLKRKSKKVRAEPYDVFIKKFSTKKNKMEWSKLNSKPLSKKSALSVGAEITDKDISASFKIKKLPLKFEKTKKGKKKRLKQVIDFEDNKYFEQNKEKFRESKIRKGTAIKTTNIFIEKAKWRLDSKEEIRQIQQASRSQGSLMMPGENIPTQQNTKVGIRNRGNVPLIDVKPQQSNPIANMGGEPTQEPNQFQKLQGGMNQVSNTFDRFNNAMSKTSNRMNINVGGLTRMRNKSTPQKRTVRKGNQKASIFRRR